MVGFTLTDADIAALMARLPTMSAEERRELEQLLAGVPPAPPAISFAEFIERAKPTYQWFDHAVVLARLLQQVADGTLRRLIVSMPPRMGKSLTITELFTAYYRYRFPMRWVGLGAYNGDKAGEYARNSRDYFMQAGGLMRAERDEEATKLQEQAGGGGLWAAGRGGSLTGKGAHLLVLDDPLKNAEEAQSVVIRAKLIDWWQSTFSTRGEPNHAIVIVMTRWHEADVVGYLMEVEKAAAGHGERGEAWHIVNFEHEKTDQPYPIPPTCTLEPDWRAVGDPLCPARYPREVMLRMKRSVGTYYWSAMHQGRPKPREGIMFKREWFTGEKGERIVKACPATVVARLRYWDLAGTDKVDTAGVHDPDWTVGVRMSLADDGYYYIEHVSRGQLSPARRHDRMKAVADADAEEFGYRTPEGTWEADRTAVPQWHEQEAGIAGGERSRDIAKALAGHIFKADPPVQDKVIRAEPAQAAAERGLFRLVEGDWNAAFLDVVTSFPMGAHDDDVDGLSGAFNKLSGGFTAVPEAFPAGAVPMSAPFNPQHG